MKHRVICILCLVLYILTVCTMLSLKIEKEMLVQVEVREVKAFPGLNQSVTLPLSALFGRQLYEVVDGIGWESGLRIRETESFQTNYETEELRIPVSENHRFVLTASRKPAIGELVEIIDWKEIRVSTDRLLAVYPDGVPEHILREDTPIFAENENVLLFYAETADGFFFEHKEKANFDNLSARNWRLYSMNTVEAFLQQVPLIALLAGVIGYILLLWCSAWIISLRTANGSRLCWFTGILSIASLALIGILLAVIDLPAAMLPDTNILQFSYYATELQAVTESLRTLDMHGAAFLGMLRNITVGSTAILCGALALALISILGEIFYICRSRYKKT